MQQDKLEVRTGSHASYYIEDRAADLDRDDKGAVILIIDKTSTSQSMFSFFEVRGIDRLYN